MPVCGGAQVFLGFLALPLYATGLCVRYALGMRLEQEGRHQMQMTTHHVSGHVVHADARWNNGNSRTGLALAVHLHLLGRPGPCHVVHRDDKQCEHCGQQGGK